MPDWIVQVLGYGGMIVGVYAGIRADLARLHERVSVAIKAAERAHERIDALGSRKP